MANQPNATVPGHTPKPDQTVQTVVETGTWMYLQEATEATGLSEKTLRRYIKKRLVKSRRLGKQTNSPFQVWITPDFLKDTPQEPEQIEGVAEAIDAEEEDCLDESLLFDAEPPPPEETNVRPTSAAQGQISFELDQVIRTIAQQFADKLDEQKELIFELKNELHEKEAQLRLLPDFQQKLEEKEKLSEFEKAALLKQIEELNQENQTLKQQAEAAKTQKQPWWKAWFGPGQPAP